MSPTNGPSQPIRFLKQHEVTHLTGVPKSTIYSWMKDGKFPRPRKTGVRAVAWTQADIEKWMGACGIA